MDIEYLLFLQGLRETAPQWVSEFLFFMSEVTVGFVVRFGIPAVLFWCLSKRAGSFLLCANAIASSVNGLVKDIACVYRPWIRDPRVDCAIKATATGYSFPSGHTTTGVAIYGGCGVLLKKYGTWITVLCFIPAILTGFAQNWIGAHTPQDVVCGFTLSLVMLLLTVKLFAWIDENPDKDWLVMLVGLVIGVAILVYVGLKSYPMDYTADGTLLVDPQKMMRDCFREVGRMIGFFTGWIFEQRFIKFNVDGTFIKRVIRGAIGVATSWAVYIYLRPVCEEIMGHNIGGCVYGALFMIYVLAIYPALFKFVEGKISKKK